MKFSSQLSKIIRISVFAVSFFAAEQLMAMEPGQHTQNRNVPQASAQRRSRSRRMAQGVYKARITPHWFAENTCFWYRNNLSGNLVVVSPDTGGVVRARAFAKRLDADLAIIDKRRDKPNVAKAMAVIGDVKDKIAIILDDMADTAGTLAEASAAVMDRGAAEVHACCSHAVLSGPAIDRICSSHLKSVVVTDTIPLNEKAVACGKIKTLSIAELVGEAIIRSHRGDSVTSLFV